MENKDKCCEDVKYTCTCTCNCQCDCCKDDSCCEGKCECTNCECCKDSNCC